MGTHPIFESDFDCLTVIIRYMGRRKESSDEYEPENAESGSENDRRRSSESEPELPPEILTERKAKINRKNVVESEDSDKISSESGSNSDDFIPQSEKNSKKKMTKMRKMKRGHETDSDGDFGTPTKKIKSNFNSKAKKPRRRKAKVSESSASNTTASESGSESENEVNGKTSGPEPVDELVSLFQKIPRSDIVRAFFQNSCQIEATKNWLRTNWMSPEGRAHKLQNEFASIPKADIEKALKLNGMNYEGTKKWLSRTWTSGYFNSQNGARPNSRIEQHSDSGSESENEKNLDSDSASEEGEKDEEPTIKKKKVLNSSDEEWCPEPKKSKPKKKKSSQKIIILRRRYG